MFKSYFKIAFRSLLKYKGSSFVNIIGLAVGFSCSIIIFLYLQNELTYDSYHENADRIYRISSTFVTSGEPVRFAIASPALGPRLKEEFPEVEEYVRIITLPQMLFVQKERDIIFYEEHVVLADPSVFKVFTYEFVKGNPATCLNEPQSIVLTEELAKKYFGKEDPIGKILNVDNDDDMKVTGVIKAPPQNSHLLIDAIASYSSWDGSKEALTWPMFEIVGFTYVLFPENYDLATFYEKWPAFYEKYCAKDGERYGQVFEPNFIKLEDIRYGSMPFRGDVEVGSRSYLYAFFFIGIFILVLACINTINMTTAHAATRTKEIGIKKVLGSDRRSLILQLLGESLFVTFLALLAAFVLVEIIVMVIPVEQLLNFEIQLNLFSNLLLLFGSFGLAVFIGVTSGLYPAFYISSFQPAQAMSGTFRSGKKGLFIRRTLVTSQFVISIGVVVMMLFMNAQLDFMRNKDLGFKKENVLIIPIRDNSVAQGVPSLNEELLKYPEVMSVATGSR
ncbi:MAG: ABC transporter permease, partial [bacterium]